MATGVRPGLSRREQEKARKKIQRQADKYIGLMDSFIGQQPVKLPSYHKPVRVIAHTRGETQDDLDMKYPDEVVISWTPTQYKAAQEQLNKIIPNLKTVEVAESAKDAANLVSSTPVDDEQEQKEWLDRNAPKVIDGGQS